MSQSTDSYQLSCDKQSQNLTFAAILLSGPSNKLDLLTDYYNYYLSSLYPEDTGEEFYQERDRQLRLHIDFMIQVLSMPSITQANVCAASNRIVSLALEWNQFRFQPKTQEKRDNQACLVNAPVFLFRFFSWFNLYMQNVLDLQEKQRTSSGESKRTSVMWRAMKTLPENQLAESIQDSLMCTKMQNGFQQWIEHANDRSWDVRSLPKDFAPAIQSQVELSKDLILEYHYYQCMKHLIHTFGLSQCTSIQMHSEELKSAQHPYDLQERLEALKEFQYLMSSRLHQIEEEAQADHQSMCAYLDQLYEKGKVVHEEFPKPEFQSVSTKENRRLNRQSWKRLSNSHFAHDFKDLTNSNHIDSWNAF